MPENGSVAEFLESFSDFVEDFNIFADPDMKETGITISRNQSFSVRLNAVEIFQTDCAYEALWSAMMMQFIFNISYNKNTKNIGNLIALKVYPELSSGTISKRIMSKLKLWNEFVVYYEMNLLYLKFYLMYPQG